MVISHIPLLPRKADQSEQQSPDHSIHQAIELRYRQVHLDFHTSEYIDDVAAQFDAEHFADTLLKAHVDSVTCFARCHHGWLYYDSKLFPERIHPNLCRTDLLREQIEACHRRGIRVPIYVTVQWDAYSGRTHPEWKCIDGNNNRPCGTLDPGFYAYLDVYHPGYRQFLKQHVQELLETLPVDGLFFDIVNPIYSRAPHWIDGMLRLNLNPESEADCLKFAHRVVNEWKLEMTQWVRQFNSDCTIFYNSGHIGPNHLQSIKSYTHWELESLPSGGWGYLHFPIAMRYARQYLPSVGMTGKFHSSWGDFNSYKNKTALEYECFQALALGAGCSIGDQMHPSGQLSPATYELIGSVYSAVARKEPWCREARAMADIAVVTPEACDPLITRNALPMSIFGVTRMLQETQQQFDIIDLNADFEAYKLVVLPDDIRLTRDEAAKLDRYVQEGGSIIASHRSGMDKQADEFVLKALNVDYVREAPYEPDFICAKPPLDRGLPGEPLVMYSRGLQVAPRADGRIAAVVQRPYFNRTWRHYCSHMHAPSSGEVVYPGIVASPRCIYFAHPIFTQYQKNTPRWYKQLFVNAVESFLAAPLIRVFNAPSTLLVSINVQPKLNRYIVHLLHYIPERRGTEFDIIEDVIPLHDLEIGVHVPHAVTAVAMVPEKVPLDFRTLDGGIRVCVPKLAGHQMIELAYET